MFCPAGNNLSAQSGFPVYDSTTISQAMRGTTKDIGFRTDYFRSGVVTSAQLKGIKLKNLYAAIKGGLVADGTIATESPLDSIHILQDSIMVAYSNGVVIDRDTIRVTGTIPTLGGDVTGTLPAMVVGNDSHTHAAGTITTPIVSSVFGVTNDGGDIDYTVQGNITVTPSDGSDEIDFNVPYQVLSRYLNGLKLTKPGAASNYVSLPDSSITNEIQTLSKTSAGTYKLTNGAGASTFINVADSSSSNEIQRVDTLVLSGNTLGISLLNDGVAQKTLDLTGVVSGNNQTLSKPSAGTYKLTNIGAASTFINVADSSSTNEVQTLSRYLLGLKLSKPSGSDYVDLPDSSSSNELQTLSRYLLGLKLTNGPNASTYISLPDSSSSNEIQTVSRYLNGLKITNGFSASTYLNLPDSLSTNEGQISVGGSTDSTAYISSNTSGSAKVVFEEGAGITITRTADTIYIANSASLIAASYQVYTANISQSSTSDPVPTVYNNTLSGTPVWVRATTGVYSLTLLGAFPSGYTTIQCNFGNTSGTAKIIEAYRTSDNVIRFNTYDAAGAAVEMSATSVFVEVRVYQAP